MIPSKRKDYNEQFSEEKYNSYLQELAARYPGQLDFRIAETPVFVPDSFWQKMQAACESIIDVVNTPAYKQKSERAIPTHLRVPNEDGHPHFIAFDFGICTNEKGDLEPQLIEMQGFPTIFAWQIIQPEVHQHHFG
ncbi:MAG: hypothetical protein M3Q06_00745, partial [Bacteroidota bacterium]|nr:hypothetical protein [Bacteroidota bacterium]